MTVMPHRLFWSVMCVCVCGSGVDGVILGSLDPQKKKLKSPIHLFSNLQQKYISQTKHSTFTLTRAQKP